MTFIEKYHQTGSSNVFECKEIEPFIFNCLFVDMQREKSIHLRRRNVLQRLFRFKII